MVVEEKPVEVEAGEAGGESQSKKAAKKLAKEAAKAAKVSPHILITKRKQWAMWRDNELHNTLEFECN